MLYTDGMNISPTKTETDAEAPTNNGASVFLWGLVRGGRDIPTDAIMRPALSYLVCGESRRVRDSVSLPMMPSAPRQPGMRGRCDTEPVPQFEFATNDTADSLNRAAAESDGRVSE